MKNSSEWSHTNVILLVKQDLTSKKDILYFPGGPVFFQESYQDAAVRYLKEQLDINVCLPENCLHHLFTFPYVTSSNATTKVSDTDGLNASPNSGTSITGATAYTTAGSGIWGDCYECIFRGTLDHLQEQQKGQEGRKQHYDYNIASYTLSELKNMIQDEELFSDIQFDSETRHVFKLYFQRQHDLRAKRRLLKGYSNVDLEHYGLRSSSGGSNGKLVLHELQDEKRLEAIEFTRKTDDGMSTKLLPQADVILLGVSRCGKTPLSIFLSQLKCLKVANVPLVFELTPPTELKQCDPRRIFCLTRSDVDEMEQIRLSRIERELGGTSGHEKYLKNNPHATASTSQHKSTYADYSYIRKDLAKARNLAKTNDYTEIDVSGRALEECATIILSKLKERFPHMHIE